MKTILLSLTLMSLLCAGCASIVDGGDKTVQLNSNPTGAKVTITDRDGKPVSVQTTPARVPLKRNAGYLAKEDYTLSFDLPGYYTDQVHVRSVVDGWYFGNILFGGLIGVLIVDPATGANFTLSPRDINRTLVPCGAALTPDQVKAAQAKANPPPAPLTMPMHSPHGDAR